jgi:DNA-binding NtrC family response regulator
MRRVLVIEDGTEYAEFARLFLARDFEVAAAQSADAALRALAAQPIDVLLIDLRFDRAPAQILIGDLAASAERLFLAELRQAGHAQPAVFVHEFPARRLANLRRLYGDVRTVPNFDASALRRALGGEA